MHKIDIYIDTRFEGNFANGIGTYSIVLELIDEEDVPHTKEHFGGYTETTNNRIVIRAINHALAQVKEPCEIEIHTGSGYAAGVINSDRVSEWKDSGNTKHGKKVKNADLWWKFEYLSRKHLIYATEEKENSYSGAMAVAMKNQKIEYEVDNREV